VPERSASAAGGAATGAGASTDGRGPAGGEAGVFDRDTAVRRLAGLQAESAGGAEASFAAEISPEWCINGRPNGGYLAAILLRALIETVADPSRAPRSLTIHFLRPPQPGAALIGASVERAGRSLSMLSGRIEQHGELVALALASFSLPRPSLEIAEAPLPDVAPQEQPRESSDWLRERIEQGSVPSFLGHLVIQHRGAALPFSGSQAPMQASAWLGLAEDSRPLDALALALFSDALFPTPFVRVAYPVGAPTIDLTIHFLAPPPLDGNRDPAELCLAQFHTAMIHEGFFAEDGVIWAADGTLLARSRQLALLVAPVAE
jgi:acyl-CoA thioesterase